MYIACRLKSILIRSLPPVPPSNTFSTGDDCIAIKAGRDWSGRQVNISTQNVLAERNAFLKGHGVSIGSETSGW